MRPIRLYWWPGSQRGAVANFGDAISPLLVGMVSGREVEYASPRLADMVAVGSLLNHVVDQRWKRLLSGRIDPLRVWGTGAFHADHLRRGSWLKIAAIRGALTRDAMHLPATMPLGDPGLLVSRLVERPAGRSVRWGVVPHYIERDLPVVAAVATANPAAVLIDLTDPDPIATAQRIASCSFIISSSLHGLITADAYGIPNVWASWSDRLVGGEWKFRDYASSVGRQLTSPVTGGSVELGALEAEATCADPTLVQDRCDGLIRAFATLGF